MHFSTPIKRASGKIRTASAAAALLLAFPFVAHAANAVFNTPSGNWLTAANWNPTTVPVSGDSVFIRSGRLATLAGNAGSVSTIYLGDNNSSGELELTSGATLTAGTVQVGRLNQPLPDGHLTINQGTLTVTTLLTIGGEQSSLDGGAGTLEFSGGTVSAATITVGASTTGKSGTLCLHGNTGSFSGTSFNLNRKGKLKFTLAAAGVTPLTIAGTATLSPNATLEVDGRAYTGGAGTITLINANTLVGSAALETVALTGFAPHYAAAVSVDAVTQNLVLTLTAISSNAGQFVERLRLGQPQKMVSYGTSITQLGYYWKQLLPVLNRQFPSQVTHWEAGNNGRNSNYGNSIELDKQVLIREPDCVFIEFTINDSVDNGQVSLTQSRTNLEAMIDRILLAEPQCEIILQLMNPAVGFVVGDSSYRHDQKAYQQVYRDVAAERGLLLVDNVAAWEAVLYPQGLENQALFKRLVPDGVHPNETGTATVVMPNIIKTLGLGVSYASWRTGYTPNASSDGQANGDNDSLSDAAEYQFAQDPNVAATAGVAGTLADGTPCYRFPSLLLRTENSDFALRVETSPNGVNTWTPLPFGRDVSTGTATGPGVFLNGTSPSPIVAYPTGQPYIRFVASPR
ncbi:SGNH/GDSL hydrolase family protein [Oleiharenicola lentus]|uniref:SGNH/GDSL hydrolase family protein n=1 Tax=Oleiharenicola lentus TaxID=2508720 RepID=UPI003F671B69